MSQLAAAGPPPGDLAQVRVCVIYDCLFPWTLGGAERWYRALAEGLAREGAETTYLTRLQWSAKSTPSIAGVQVVAVSRSEALYLEDGTRRTLPPLRFGCGVLIWLLRHRRDYDVVHVANFPYFSLIATRLALAGTRTPVSVDWFEIWPFQFWRDYAGKVGGFAGFLVQELCIRLSPHAFTFWDHTAVRLRAHGHRGRSSVLAGLLPTRDRRGAPNSQAPPRPVALFAGRHIKDKGLRLLPETMRIVRQRIPDLRLIIAGEGPETPLFLQMVAEQGVADAVDLVGRVTDDKLDELIASASCVVVASTREGYGLMVVEAAALGTPSVVAANPENAATGHVTERVNGFVVEPTPQGIADGIVRCVEAGDDLRLSTVKWFTGHATEMSMDRAVGEVVEAYASLKSEPARP